MRGAFIIVTVVTLLIVGILVIKNYNSGPSGTATKREAIEKGKEAAEKANKAMQKIKDTNKKLTETN